MTATPQLMDFIRPHFDADFYRSEYPDLEGDFEELLGHFCSIGWLEGRNPSPFFDTSTYLIVHPDVRRSGQNAYFHYLSSGRREMRSVSPSITPSVRTTLLFGYPVVDWVARVAPYVDVADYAARTGLSHFPEIDWAAHFAYRGWREGLSPCASVSTAALAEYYPQCKELLVNPIVIHLEAESGRFRPARVFRMKRTPTSSDVDVLWGDVNPPSNQSLQDIDESGAREESATSLAVQGKVHPDELVEVVRLGMSPEYYRACYPDVQNSGVDPAEHYSYTGWREGRNPSASFDTKYYLKANDDVREAGINPFWHYLVAGCAEGRLPRRPGGYRRELVDSAREPARRTDGYVTGALQPIKPTALRSILRKKMVDSRGAIISLSHDCYVRVIGGTQILISDEQRRFNDKNYTYIHISPFYAELRLSDRSPGELIVRVVLNGDEIGTIPLLEIAKEIDSITSKYHVDTLLTVHSVFGFSVDCIVAIHNAIKPRRSFFWLHDYSSICEGYNLLRNDLEFCGAPGPESMACRVCVCGPSRFRHIRELGRLFERISFEVVSPSAFTLSLWSRSVSLPHASATVHPHWLLTSSGAADRRRAAPLMPGRRLSIAFVGFPVAHKGWPLFTELVADPALGGYSFFQFSARGAPSVPGVNFVTTEVRGESRDAAVDLLRSRRIDIVAVTSPWPETFSFVAYEALSAGCAIVCLKDSGNVADLARAGYGAVFESGDAMREFLGGPNVAEWLRIVRRKLRTTDVVRGGATATIDGVIE